MMTKWRYWRVVTGRHAHHQKAYLCPDSLRRNKELFYNGLNPFRLMKAKKYPCDVTLAVQHDCRWNPLVVIVVCQFACGPTDWER